MCIQNRVGYTVYPVTSVSIGPKQCVSHLGYFCATALLAPVHLHSSFMDHGDVVVDRMIAMHTL
jgi:hypothetical protein